MLLVLDAMKASPAHSVVLAVLIFQDDIKNLGDCTMQDEHELEIRTIHRKEAMSGRISYGTPIVLHASSRTRQVLLSFYIPRTAGTELAIKLITYQKAAAPHDWLISEDKSISLQESAARELLIALKEHFAVAAHNEHGDYIAIKVADGQLNIGEIDPSVVAKAIIGVLHKEDIARHLTSKELGTELAFAFRGAIRLKELLSAVSTLRNNLDQGITDEEIYQKWCEQHTWAFGNMYIVRDEIREISPGDEIDLLLPTVIAGYRDLIELKRPNMDVLHYDTSHRNYYFSHDASKAIGQCHRYLDVLHEVAQKGLRDHPEIVAYHPRSTIVIGRSAGWDEDKLRALHGLNHRLSGIKMMTYDQLLAQGEHLVEILSAEFECDEREIVDDLEIWEEDLPIQAP